MTERLDQLTDGEFNFRGRSRSVAIHGFHEGRNRFKGRAHLLLSEAEQCAERCDVELHTRLAILPVLPSREVSSPSASGPPHPP
jgi:hypothetical protein